MLIDVQQQNIQENLEHSVICMNMENSVNHQRVLCNVGEIL